MCFTEESASTVAATNVDVANIVKRSGIVDECCHAQCDIDTLQLYCLYSPSENDAQVRGTKLLI